MSNGNLTPREFEIGEHKRITDEIQKDRDLQFRLFWQSITATAIIVSFCATIFTPGFWLRFPFVIIAPHLILIPTASIILNRARTANRKSSYLLVLLDHYSQLINWEKDLARLRFAEKLAPHRPVTIRNMLITITALETILILVMFVLLFSVQMERIEQIKWIIRIVCFIYSITYAHLLGERFRNYFCLRYHESIQGYSYRWTQTLDLKDVNLTEIGGPWNKDSWKNVLLKERSGKGPISIIWKIIWSKSTKPEKDWELKKSYIKPLLFGALIFISISAIIHFSRIEIPSSNPKSKTQEIKIDFSILDSLISEGKIEFHIPVAPDTSS